MCRARPCLRLHQKGGQFATAPPDASGIALKPVWRDLQGSFIEALLPGFAPIGLTPIGSWVELLVTSHVIFSQPSCRTTTSITHSMRRWQDGL